MDYLVQYADGSEVVLHLLESREDSLPIVGHSYIVGCLRLPHLRAARSSVQDGLREARPDLPDAVRPVQEIRRRRALEPSTRGQQELHGKNGWGGR